MKAIPDTSKWVPRRDAVDTLEDIFYKRCMHVEALIMSRSKHEQELNIDNFDSGIGIEDIIRDEFSKLLPKRYLVTKGVINDRNGLTSGDSDLVIFNELWFPYLKHGATMESRRFHFPIEGVYAVGEIKQTLTLDALDKSIEKLVIVKRLNRPKTSRTRIVENRELDDCIHGSTNTLYSFFLANNLHSDITIDDIFLRFFNINKELKTHEMVNSLCILQKGSIFWGKYEKDKQIVPYKFDFISDNDFIIPILLEVDSKRRSAFYDLIMHLSAHLYNSILGGEDLVIAYGNSYHDIKIPSVEKFLLKTLNS